MLKDLILGQILVKFLANQFYTVISISYQEEGDVDNPQGGVRSVIPTKQHYKTKEIACYSRQIDQSLRLKY